MTSVVAWCGVDSRGPASIYFATDSRETQGASVISDGTRKTFAASRSANVFAYCGHVLGPVSTLATVSESIERMRPADDVETAQAQFRTAVEAGWQLHRPVPVETVLLHAVRCGAQRLPMSNLASRSFGSRPIRVTSTTKSSPFPPTTAPFLSFWVAADLR